MTQTLSFIVLSATLAPFATCIKCEYQPADNPMGILKTEIDADDFWHYLQCQHDTDRHYRNLEDWYLHPSTTPPEVHIRIAQFMEYKMSSEERRKREMMAHVPMCYEDHYDQRTEYLRS